MKSPARHYDGAASDTDQLGGVVRPAPRLMATTSQAHAPAVFGPNRGERVAQLRCLAGLAGVFLRSTLVAALRAADLDRVGCGPSPRNA
jgi:hypothetical protein